MYKYKQIKKTDGNIKFESWRVVWRERKNKKGEESYGEDRIM